MAKKATADVGHLTNVSPEELLAGYTPNSPEEKALLRKIDARIVPAVFFMYLLSYLDRANIGNAKTAGMQTELGMTSTQYSVVLLVFFVGYVLGEVPSNMLLTRLRPSLYLPGIMFLWGAVSLAFAGCHSWQSIAVVRLVIGTLESGFGPGVAYLLSSWYRKNELGSRFALYYSATAVSGALGGLIAGAVTSGLDGVGGLSGWRWLFLIEGSATILGCGAALFMLPDYPTTTRWLSEDEKRLAAARLLYDSVGQSGGPGASHSHIASLVEALLDWRTWGFTFIFMMTTGSQTIQYFVPTLMTQLGYSGNMAQYMTIPPYLVAAVFIIGLGFLSDRTGERALVISSATAMAAICFVVDLTSYNTHVQYAFLCFAIGGVWASCFLVLVYLSNVIAWPSEKRAVSQAFVNAMGNSASIYGSFLWADYTAPRYRPGFSTTIAMLLACSAATLLLRYLVGRYPYVISDADAAQHGSDSSVSEKNQDVEFIKSA
ncbi:hypothetical protein HK405_003786 [Cladochytrium tenue]|nr:hypothetical protein HK405_003786 [Cladochytrium tenue]